MRPSRAAGGGHPLCMPRCCPKQLSAAIARASRVAQAQARRLQGAVQGRGDGRPQCLNRAVGSSCSCAIPVRLSLLQPLPLKGCAVVPFPRGGRGPPGWGPLLKSLLVSLLGAGQALEQWLPSGPLWSRISSSPGFQLRKGAAASEMERGPPCCPPPPNQGYGVVLAMLGWCALGDLRVSNSPPSPLSPSLLLCPLPPPPAVS